MSTNKETVIDGVTYAEHDFPNPYYKTDHGLYSVPEAQFLDYLQREGTTIQDYWTGEKYRCFFRRNKDTNQTNDNISVYYKTDTGIHPGSIITHYSHTYLILNQESIENRVYHRSDGMNADVMLSTYNPETHEEINVPCFAYDLTGIVPDQDEVMNLLNGNVEMMTGDCEETRKLAVNCEFYAMGNWYKIGSINYKTGIARIGASIVLDPHRDLNYDININTEDAYTTGDSTQFKATATLNGQPVDNATLIWSSGDSSIIEMDEKGNATFVGAGTCAVNCYWKEHDLTKTVYVEVIEKPVVVEYRCAIDGSDTIVFSGTKTYTAIFYKTDGVGEDDSIEPIWSLNLTTAQKAYITIASQSGKTIDIKSSGKSGNIGETFSLNLTDASGNYHATKTIKITGWL